MASYPYVVYFKTAASAAYATLHADKEHSGTVALPKRTKHTDLSTFALQMLGVAKQAGAQALNAGLKVIPLLGIGHLFRLPFVSDCLSKIPFSLPISIVQIPGQTALFMLVSATLTPVIEALYKKEENCEMLEQTELYASVEQICQKLLAQKAAKATAGKSASVEASPLASPKSRKKKVLNDDNDHKSFSVSTDAQYLEDHSTLSSPKKLSADYDSDTELYDSNPYEQPEIEDHEEDGEPPTELSSKNYPVSLEWSDERTVQINEIQVQAASCLVALAVTYLVGRVQNHPVGLVTCVAILSLQKAALWFAEQCELAVYISPRLRKSLAKLL
jgi:hypothetical protein